MLWSLALSTSEHASQLFAAASWTLRFLPETEPKCGWEALFLSPHALVDRHDEGRPHLSAKRYLGSFHPARLPVVILRTEAHIVGASKLIFYSRGAT